MFKKIVIFFVSILVMKFMQPAVGQSLHVNKIAWSVKTELPATSAKAPHLGLAGVFTGVTNGVLLVGGGANFPHGKPWEGGAKAYLDEVYVLEKKSDSAVAWRSGVQFKLPRPTAYGVSTTVANSVVCIGGETPAGLSASAYMLRWDASENRVRIEALPDLPEPTANAGCTHIGNHVYVTGGETSQGPGDHVYMLDLDAVSPQWKKLPNLPQAMSHNLTVSQSNGEYACVYVAGGRTATASGISELHGSMYCYDPKKNTWKTLSALTDDKGNALHWSAGTGVAVGASYILLTGGDNGTVYTKIETYNKSIREATTPAEKDSLQQAKVALLTAHPGFGRDVYLYNTITDKWCKTGTLPFAAQVTTTAVWWNDAIMIPSGEVMPGTRTPVVTEGKLAHPSFFAAMDYIILLVYLLAMVGIGVWTSRHQHSTNDYFRGGQKIPGWATALSIFGAKLSAITFIGIPAKTYAGNWTYFLLQMTIVAAMPFVVHFFIPFYRRLAVTSSYEYLEKRFSYPVRAIAALMYVLLQLGRMGIVILLPSIALSVVTGIDVKTSIVVMGLVSLFYTVLGGIEAVIWTEVVQVIILLAGALLSLVLIPLHLKSNGITMVHTLQAFDKLKIFDMRFNFNASTFWVVVIGGLALNIIQYGCDQTVVQRYLTTKDERTAVRSLKVSTWMTFPATLIFFSIGTLLFLFYRDNPQQVNVALDSQDTIFPWYIVTQMPAGIAGLVITAVFAAAMSSLNGSVNGVATVIVNDFFRRLFPAHTDVVFLRAARVATLVIGLMGTAIAYVMASWGITSLWDQFNLILGLFIGSVGGLFFLGIFTSRTTARGAVTGFVLSCLIQYFILLHTQLNFLMYAFTGLASCMLLGYIASIITPGHKKELSGLTIYQQ